MIRPFTVPRVLAAGAQLRLLAADCLALVFAATIVIRTRGRKSRPAAAVATLLTPLSIGAGALYTRSFAIAPQDECYALAMPALLALGGYLFIGAVPGITLDRKSGIATLAAGFAACALLRVMLHGRIARIKPRAGTGRIATPPGAAAAAVKRTMDVVLTAAAAPVAALVGSIVAVTIVFDGGGPVFFVQQRVGRDGRPFRLFKFRTMRPAAGDAWAVVDDPRITRVGRFLRRTSLDELPQLLNVLRGEMSLVGPRPEMVDYADRFAQRLPRYSERMRVKPGITGWAQVSLTRVLTDDDIGKVLEADLFYVANGSPALDGAIIVKTAIEVLFHRVA